MDRADRDELEAKRELYDERQKEQLLTFASAITALLDYWTDSSSEEQHHLWVEAWFTKHHDIYDAARALLADAHQDGVVVPSLHDYEMPAKED